MSSGVFPFPEFRSTQDDSASVALRLRTRLRRPGLDVDLAQGDYPSTSPELALRAAQLRSPAERRRLANALIRAVGGARGPNLGAFARRARRRDAAILDTADDLLALAARLRDDRPVSVEGAAMAARLVDDRAGVLHRGPAQELRAATQAIQRALGAPATSVPEHLAAAA